MAFFSINGILYAQVGVKWNTEKSTHFIVYYKNAPEDFIKQTIDKSEDYYNKIADNLGFIRFNFWLWDERAKIYIYDDLADYQSATGEPNWSYGSSMANAKTKIIRAFPHAQRFFENILPHEMGHIIFREFVGFKNPAIPIWLDEGVASYQEESRLLTANKVIKKALGENKFYNLQELANTNPHLMLDTESVNLFYAESLSLVDYLIREFGRDKFVLFCQNLRDKNNMDRAIASSYSFANTQELDQSWQKYVENE